jgi:hypothetical protein
MTVRASVLGYRLACRRSSHSRPGAPHRVLVEPQNSCPEARIDLAVDGEPFLLFSSASPTGGREGGLNAETGA